MRVWVLPLFALLTMGLIPPAAGAPVPPVATFAFGDVDYVLVEESGVPPSCSGPGPFTVTFQPNAARILVAGSAVGCVPIWSLISQCHYLPDLTVRCQNGGIDVTLAPDGTFDYVWAGSGFHEEMHGVLTRLG